MRRGRLWARVAVAIAALVILLAPSVVTGWQAPLTATSPAPAKPAPVHSAVAEPTPALASDPLFPPGVPVDCYLLAATSAFGLLGPGCGYAASYAAWEAFATSSESSSAKNIMTLLANSLNITNAFVANLNATMQELLSYYEGRAEAVVPYFLGDKWNLTTYDQIAIDSGLVPAIEGMVMAFASQEYQDWNATRVSWDNLFGHTGTFGADRASLDLNLTGYAGTGENDKQGGPIAINGENFNVTAPFEAWSAATATGFSNPTYFNLMPGGTIVCVTEFVPGITCPTYTVTDLTSHTSFSVPIVTRSHFVNSTTLPIESTLQSIHTFDLLKLACTASCGNGVFWVEVSGGYAFRNTSVQDPDHVPLAGEPGYAPYDRQFSYDTMIPQLYLAGSSSFSAVEPSLAATLCIHEGSSHVEGPCSTPKVNAEGNSVGTGSLPGDVAGSNRSLTRFASTMQSVVNNTLQAAHVYFLTLSAITDKGKYPVPSDCAIPLPSDALPTAIAPADYVLSTDDGLAVYWAYMNAVGIAYDNTPFHGLEFCGDHNLGLKFNWAGSWKLKLNISASVYLGNPNGTGSNINGTFDRVETYSNPATWPVIAVKPSLLFPYEFQADIPVGAIYPIPFNDPMAMLLVNYTGNLLYDQPSAINETPAWGIPTYLTLNGEGNAVSIAGTTTSESTGIAADTGDAIYIQTCKLSGVAQSPCDVGVTYFSNFTYGHVSGLVGPISPPSGGFASTVGAAASACGFSYLGLLGDVGAAVAVGIDHLGGAAGSIPIIGGALAGLIGGIGCLLGWIVEILVFVLFIYIGVWVLRAMIGAGRSTRRTYGPPRGAT